jgi:putative ABC transport system ATP-binding protein
MSATDLIDVRGRPLDAGTDLAVRCDEVVHIYRSEGVEFVALRGIDLTVRAGETVALLGPSGAGKSTLLWLLAGLLTPSAGSVEVFGHRMHKLDSRALARVRASTIGVVLQNPGRNLLPYATALQNIGFAHARAGDRQVGDEDEGGVSARRRGRGPAELLELVGLQASAHRAAGGLSGGEQQRLAVAVALANAPRLLLADEPTSQLDQESARRVVALLQHAADDGTTVVVVTHDRTVSEAFGRTITIRDGVVGAEGRRGEEFVVVGKDGGIQLPPDVRELMPPGTLARLVVREDGVDLRIARPDEEHTPRIERDDEYRPYGEPR